MACRIGPLNTVPDIRQRTYVGPNGDGRHARQAGCMAECGHESNRGDGGRDPLPDLEAGSAPLCLTVVFAPGAVLNGAGGRFLRKPKSAPTQTSVLRRGEEGGPNEGRLEPEAETARLDHCLRAGAHVERAEDRRYVDLDGAFSEA